MNFHLVKVTLHGRMFPATGRVEANALQWRVFMVKVKQWQWMIQTMHGRAHEISLRSDIPPYPRGRGTSGNTRLARISQRRTRVRGVTSKGGNSPGLRGVASKGSKPMEAREIPPREGKMTRARGEGGKSGNSRGAMRVESSGGNPRGVRGATSKGGSSLAAARLRTLPANTPRQHPLPPI